MKKSLKTILIGIAACLAVGLLIAVTVFFIPRDNTSFSFECFRLRCAASDFLKDVKQQRYDEAFDRIYCVSAEDDSPLTSGESFRDVWTQRVSALREKDNTYLNGFSDLSVRKEDGSFTFTVTLSVTRQGYNDPFYANGSVITAVYDGGWKFVSVSEYDPSLQTALEKALSGRFTFDERANEET